MRKQLSLLFCMWICASLSVGALPLCLELELKKTTTSRQAEVVEEPAETVKVVLAEDYLEFEGRDGRTVHDFKSFQSHLVKGDNYVRRSLYADIGFRAAEVRNRLAIMEALRQAELEGIEEDAVAVEHLFSLDDEVTQADIEKNTGAFISYKHKGKLLAQFSEKGKGVSAEQSKSFVRFLRYYIGGHPDILSDVQVRRVIPDQLRIDLTNLSELTSYEVKVRSVESCQGVERPDFSSLKPTTLPPEPLGTLVALALQLPSGTVQRGHDHLVSRAQEALSQRRALESALLLFEALLMRGGQPPELLSAERSTFDTDSGSKELFDALLMGQESAERSAEMFEALVPKAGQQGHVVKIFRAGMLISLRKMVEARNLYIEALMVNPAIVGAWKDLGDIYYANYEMDTAWLCWDVGRQLLPEHSMMQEVGRLEQALRSNYPGYF